MNFDFILYSFLIALLFVYCGIGLTLFICPKKFENYILFFSPFVGLAYLGLFTWWGIHLVSGGINAFIYPLLILPAFFLLLALFTRKDQLLPIFWVLRTETLFLIILCIIIYLIISLPNIVLLNNLNVLVVGNNDIINYATISKFLTRSSLINPVPGVDAHILYLIENNNFGAFIAAAVPSSFFAIQTYMLENIIENLFFIFSLPIIYLIAVEIFTYKSQVAFIATLLIGVNIHLIYILYTGFVGQVIGCSIFLALLLVTLYPLLSYEQNHNFHSFIPLASVLMFGMIMTYSPLILLFFVPILLYLIIVMSSKKSAEFIWNPLKFLIITTIISFAIAPTLFIDRLQELTYFAQSIAAGWPMPPITPEQIVGLVGNDVGWFPIQNAVWSPPLIPVIFLLLVSFLVLFVFFLSLKKLSKDQRLLFFFAMAFLLIIFMVYIYYIIIDYISPTFTGEYYKAYKLLTYGIPMVIIIFLSYFKDLNLFKCKDKCRYCMIFLVVLVLGNIWSGAAMMDMVSQKSYPIKASVIDLQRLNEMQNISSLNIEERSYSDQMWIYYFLFMNHTIHLQYTTYFQKSPLTGEWTLKTRNEDILNLENLEEIIPLNDDYYLVKNGSSSFRVDFKEGWYETESWGNSIFRWSSYKNQSPVVGIYSPSKKVSIDLDLTYKPLIADNSFAVYLNDKKITECTNEHFCELNRVIIYPGIHNLTFEPRFPPISPGPEDPRTLGYVFIYINMTSNTSTSGVTA